MAKKMRVRLIDIDGKMPNLALMKLSAYHKARGDLVDLNLGSLPDQVYLSTIFTKSKALVESIARMFCGAIIGGSGWDLKKTLPDEIEGLTPDYELYGIKYGLGFTSRGCIRHCPFCVVPEKEGWIRSMRTVAEIRNPRSDVVVLLDNNFLASPDWEARIDEILEMGLKVDFNQGLDIRLVDDYVARRLREVNPIAYKSRVTQIKFGFDNPEMEPAVRRGIVALKKAGFTMSHVQIFMLVGFDTTFEQDMERFKMLAAEDIRPFVMLYEGSNRRLQHFARWVNRRIYGACSWEEYRYWRQERPQLALLM